MELCKLQFTSMDPPDTKTSCKVRRLRGIARHDTDSSSETGCEMDKRETTGRQVAYSFWIGQWSKWNPQSFRDRQRHKPRDKEQISSPMDPHQVQPSSTNKLLQTFTKSSTICAEMPVLGRGCGIEMHWKDVALKPPRPCTGCSWRSRIPPDSWHIWSFSKHP